MPRPCPRAGIAETTVRAGNPGPRRKPHRRDTDRIPTCCRFVILRNFNALTPIRPDQRRPSIASRIKARSTNAICGAV